MDTERFRIPLSLMIGLALVATWPGVMASSQNAPALDVSERFLSWAVDGNQDLARLGTAISAAGDVNADSFDDLIVSASNFDGASSDTGRAYLYLGSSIGLGAMPAWHEDGTISGGGFAWKVTAAGDVNGDGFDDVLVGDRPDLGQSPFYLYYGGPNGPSTTPGWSQAGSTAASAGDVNGDGYDDIVVGWAGYSNDQAWEGVAWVFLGSSTGIGASPSWTLEGNQYQAYLGWDVSGAGDTNGDGYDDVLIGAPYYDAAFTECGAAYVFLGSPSGLQSTPAWTRFGDANFAYLGRMVDTAGDVNRDGYDEVVVWIQAYSQ